jgi:hypothetical protein
MIEFMEKVIFGLNFTNSYVSLCTDMNKVIIFGVSHPLQEESNLRKKIHALDHPRRGSTRSNQELHVRFFGDSFTSLLYGYEKDSN